MKNYQQGRVQPIENNFVVEWTVKGSDGQSASETRPLADSKVAFAAPNVAGALQVEALIKDRGQVIARQSGDADRGGDLHAGADADTDGHAHAGICRGDRQVQRQRPLRAGHRLW